MYTYRKKLYYVVINKITQEKKREKEKRKSNERSRNNRNYVA